MTAIPKFFYGIHLSAMTSLKYLNLSQSVQLFIDASAQLRGMPVLLQ